MALAVAVTLEPERDAARLDVTGITAAGKTLTVARTSPSGAVAGVRGAVGVSVAGLSTFITRDYELPLDVAVVYTATTYDAAGGQVATVTAAPFTVPYDACEAWLVDLARSLNSLPVVVESLNELNYQVPSGVHHVLNRRAPVVTALPAYTPEGELVVLTSTLDERDQVRALLGSGYPFLVRTDPAQGIGNAYFASVAFVEERFITAGTAPERRFRISCVQVERPDPAIYVPLAPNVYSNVKATYSTYADLKAAVSSYDTLAYAYPSGIANPILPWPPDDI